MSHHNLSTKAQQAAADKAFKQAINHCRVAIATGKMRTMHDVGMYLGFNVKEHPNIKAILPKGLNWFDPINLRVFIVDCVPLIEEYRKNPPELTPQEKADITTSHALLDKVEKKIEEVTSVYEEHPLDKLNWLPPPNPRQRVTQFPFQAKASKDLAYRLCVEDKRGVLLRASVGVGKTYIYGQLLRWLWDRNAGEFFKCVISPWPALIITKASIVEQTRRVMVDDFGLDPHRQVSVLNYDALRSNKGLETMLEKSYVVQNAERVVVYKWRPYMRPRLVIIDESQSAKNEDATQSKIIFNLASGFAKGEEDNVKFIASSATPFTRVSEAKYFVVNAGIPYRMV